MRTSYLNIIQNMFPWFGARLSFASLVLVLHQTHNMLAAYALTGVINQEDLIAQLSKALTQIADALPRAALKLILYPTETMRNAVAVIYALMIKFLKRQTSLNFRNQYAR
jgi:hypothetical protein